MDSAVTLAQRKKLQKAQAEVDEVAVIMKDSIDKLMDRGDKLETLMENAGKKTPGVDNCNILVFGSDNLQISFNLRCGKSGAK